MVDNKSDPDSPTPFATGSTSAAEVSTAAAGSTGHSTSSQEHNYADHHSGSHEHPHAEVPEDERVSGPRADHAPSATEQAADREPAEGGDIDGMDDTMREATGAGDSGDMVEQTGNAGFSPGTEGGLSSAVGGDPSEGNNTAGETSPAPNESRPPEQL